MQNHGESTTQLRFQAQLLDSVRESVVAADLDGTVIYWGKGAEALYGYSSAEAVGRSVTFIAPPGCEEDILRRIEQVRRTGSCSGEYLQRRKDGSTFLGETQISLVRDTKGQPYGLIGIDRDVTERKQAEEALRISAKNYREIFNAADDMIVLHDAQTGEVLEVNAKVCEVFGFPPEAAARVTLADLCREPGHTPQRALEHLRRANEQGSQLVEWRFRKQDGTRMWAEVLLKPAIINGTRRTLAVFRDVTARKHAEETLRQAHGELEQRVEEQTAHLQRALEELQELHDVVSHSPAVVFRWRLEEDWPVEFVTENIRQFGYTAEELRSGTVSWPGMTHPDDLPRLSKEVEQYLREGRHEFHQEYRLITRSGEVRWVRDWNRTLTNNAGEVTHIHSIVLDVTDRKETEEALRRAEEQFRAIFEASTDCILVWDRDGNYLYANQAAINYVGTTRDKVIGKNIRDGLAHEPEFMKLWMSRIEQVFATGQPMQVEDTAHIGERTVHSESVLSPLRDSQGQMFAVGVVYRDVTERKAADNALREREALLTSMIENIPLDFWARNTEGYCFLQSREGIGNWGDLTENPFPTDNIDPQTLERWQENNSRALNGEVVRGETQLTTRDGRLRDFFNVVTPIVQEGTIRGLLGINLDITDRKRAEQAVRQSEEKYRTLAEQVNDIPYSMDSNGILTYIGPQVARYGYAPEEMVRRSFLEFVDPQDRERMASEFQRATTMGEEFPSDFRIRTTDGRVFWLEDEGRLQRNESDRIVGITGILRDVTERRQLARALRESESLLRQVLDLNPACIFIKNHQGVFVLANRAIAEFFGTTPEAMIGRRALEFCDPAIAQSGMVDKFLRDDQEVIESRKLKIIPEEMVTDSDGVVRYYETMKIPISIKGDPHCVLAVAAEITDRKRAEQTILEEQQRLRHLLSMHERDRQLVAYEIHDGFAQPLTAALMQLESGLQAVKNQYPDVALKQCDSAIDLLRRSIDEARRLMGGLRPAVLDEFGVVAAVESLVGECQNKSCAVIEFSAEVDFDRLAGPLELAIFRIVQEGLTNAVRYSESEHIRIALCQHANRLRIEVEDRGIGFDPTRIEPNRFGLEGIRVRARLFGGWATIRSSPGHGTAITAELPLVERVNEGLVELTS